MGNQVYYVHAPTPEVAYECEVVYEDVIQECKHECVWSETQLEEYLIALGLWSHEKNERIRTYPKLSDNIKLQMWQAYEKFQSKRVEQLRKQLHKLNQEFTELFSKLHHYDSYCAEGVAMWTKFEYMVSRSTTLNGKPIQEDDGKLIHWLTIQYVTDMLVDTYIRQLVKTNDWRVIWSSGKLEYSLFGQPASFLSDEQRALVSWSKMYDNIREGMEQPPPDVFDDDDLLDGWMIEQHNKRERERKERNGQKFDNKPGTTEVFIPAETEEDARRIDEMNDADARMVKRQRLTVLAQKGKIAEQDMPDSKLTMRQQAIQEAVKKMKG